MEEIHFNLEEEAILFPHSDSPHNTPTFRQKDPHFDETKIIKKQGKTPYFAPREEAMELTIAILIGIIIIGSMFLKFLYF